MRACRAGACKAKARTCRTYNYWHDLRTDLRRPTSLLDFVNMVLRRFRLVLVRDVDRETGRTVRWRLRWWVRFLDDVHVRGRCNACKEEPGGP